MGVYSPARSNMVLRWSNNRRNHFEGRDIDGVGTSHESGFHLVFVPHVLGGNGRIQMLHKECGCDVYRLLVNIFVSSIFSIHACMSSVLYSRTAYGFYSVCVFFYRAVTADVKL